jgi:hypothetical protein
MGATGSLWQAPGGDYHQHTMMTNESERLATGDKLLDTGKFFLNTNLLSYFLIDLLFVLAIYLLTRDVVIYKWVV